MNIILCNLGLFGCEEIAGYNLPFIIRVIRGEELKFVSVRMAEIQLLSKYMHSLHADIFTCASVRSHFITDSEAKLLNKINMGLSDGIYGNDTFNAGKDYIVRLEDVLEFYTFLEVCYNKILNNITPGRNEKCGFILINSEPPVPYCLKDGRKYLPMFFFEGETEHLRQHAVKLEDWNLAYLKFCFRLYCIKDELFPSESCTVITLDDIKNYYPPETHYEEYWPSNLIETPFMIDQNSTHVNPSGVWIRAPLKQDIDYTPK